MKLFPHLSDAQVFAQLATLPVDMGSRPDNVKPGHVTSWEHDRFVVLVQHLLERKRDTLVPDERGDLGWLEVDQRARESLARACPPDAEDPRREAPSSVVDRTLTRLEEAHKRARGRLRKAFNDHSAAYLPLHDGVGALNARAVTDAAAELQEAQFGEFQALAELEGARAMAAALGFES